MHVTFFHNEISNHEVTRLSIGAFDRTARYELIEFVIICGYIINKHALQTYTKVRLTMTSQ